MTFFVERETPEDLGCLDCWVEKCDGEPQFSAYYQANGGLKELHGALYLSGGPSRMSVDGPVVRVDIWVSELVRTIAQYFGLMIRNAVAKWLKGQDLKGGDIVLEFLIPADRRSLYLENVLREIFPRSKWKMELTGRDKRQAKYRLRVPTSYFRGMG